MNRDEAIFKIRKLLSLATSNNEHEAGLALEKAMELKEQFSIDDQSLENAEVYSRRKIKGRFPWRNHLAWGVAEGNGVYSMKDAGKGGYIFCGAENDVYFAKELYDYLEKAIMRISLKTIPKKAKTRYRDSYRLGMAMRLIVRLGELTGEERWNQNRKRYEALVKSYSTIVGWAPESPMPNQKAAREGAAAADGISLAKQMNGEKPKRRLYAHA